jgi:hypothetical protein
VALRPILETYHPISSSIGSDVKLADCEAYD